MVDASAVADYVLRVGESKRLQALLAARNEIHVPELCGVELVWAMRSMVFSGEATPARAEKALDHYRKLRLVRHGHERLLGRVLQLRDNFSAYDAVYAALAERLDAELLTLDDPLARAVRRHLTVPLAPR